jgi:hypothetical protein
MKLEILGEEMIEALDEIEGEPFMPLEGQQSVESPFKSARISCHSEPSEES